MQLVLMFQGPVVIDKIVWTFYYDESANPKINGIPSGWILTALDGNDDGNRTTVNVTSAANSPLRTYTMVVRGSVAAQRWGITFSGSASRWLFLSEVEIAGSSAGVCLPVTHLLITSLDNVPKHIPSVLCICVVQMVCV